ncbi:cation:proton antiporter [Aurantimonas sp. 22II-16-19i]|uniref:cation:proton antiporter n=1 Tax=Aurantimonas sp. 22II-16-19i TaxID=1317114 RepID=UPI0009F7EAD0|nr:cation:proton antiporter [Aurantimonas sp. 22II-16-19i]ORE90856.1 monovalent cation/H+ antiporter subunit F [Aurantimonas sp. 22II-16-19i]
MNHSEFARTFLDICLDLSLAMLGVAFFLTIARIIIGPTLPDRVLGLDMLTSVAIGFIAVIGIDTGFMLYVDIAIALGLVGFLATVAFARFILARGKTGDDDEKLNLRKIDGDAFKTVNKPTSRKPSR